MQTLIALTGLVIPLLVIGRGSAAVIVPVIGALVAVLLPLEEVRILAARWTRQPLGWAIATMFAVWLASVISSVEVGFSLLIWLQALGLGVLVPSLAHVLANRPEYFAASLKILIGTSFIGTAIAVVAIYLWPPLLGYVRPVTIVHSYEAAQRVKSYAAVMPCLAPVLIWAMCRLRGPWLALGVAALALGCILVEATHNRAALAGYLGAGGFAVVALGLRRLSPAFRTCVVFAVIAVGVMAAGSVVGRLPSMPFDGGPVTGIPTWIVDEHRQVIWGFVLERAMERPWFGWGPSAANLIPGANDPIPRIGQTYVPLHAHNWVLQLACDVGFIGLAAGVAVFGLLLRRIIVGARANWPAVGLTGAFFVSMLANFSIWQSWWQSVLVILLSICLAGEVARFGRTRGTIDTDAAPSSVSNS